MSPTLTLASRIRGSFTGLAVCDALGGPVEFKSRGSFPEITMMRPNDNFNLPAGCFTDDTSMALCLAHSLLLNGGLTNTGDQVQKYLAWWKNGYMSVTNECFDIGVATQSALSKWSAAFDAEGYENLQPSSIAAQAVIASCQADIDSIFSQERFCGNGSLMRVVPVALAIEDTKRAREVARESSRPTHPHPRCQDSCEIYVNLVSLALKGADKEVLLSALIGYLSGDSVDTVLQTTLKEHTTIAAWKATTETQISSSGYVIHSLEAALWAFFSTESFEAGAIRAVNLGDDADTVGAIYGGLAGAFYGDASIPRSWSRTMKSVHLLEEVVEKLITARST